MVVVIIVYLFSRTICPAKITGKYRKVRAIYIVVMVKVTLAGRPCITACPAKVCGKNSQIATVYIPIIVEIALAFSCGKYYCCNPGITKIDIVNYIFPTVAGLTK
jgi:hypothetical protein